MSDRIISIELGYEGPGGMKIVSDVVTLKPGDYLPAVLQRYMSQWKNELLADDLPIQPEASKNGGGH